MKKISALEYECYDYLDELRLYVNDSRSIHHAVENKFGLDCYVARAITIDWFSYHLNRLTHPLDRERFEVWWRADKYRDADNARNAAARLSA